MVDDIALGYGQPKGATIRCESIVSRDSHAVDKSLAPRLNRDYRPWIVSAGDKIKDKICG